jgi:hypothetical protein
LEQTSGVTEGITLQSTVNLHKNRTDQSISKKLLESNGDLFEEIYGIPITLMDLMAQVTALANEVDDQESFTYPLDLYTAKSVASCAHSLEDRICGFRWEQNQAGVTRPLGGAP